MPLPDDPFRYHPELAGEIADPLTSFFRTFTTARLAEIATEHGLPIGWWHTDEAREALRKVELARRPPGELWVFAYGSLMWDPAIRFAEVRRARLTGYARRFILKDVNGARGTAAAPGLMAALDDGPFCDGLAFRIPEALVETESEILWRRERIARGYHSVYLPVEIAGGSVVALAFVADRTAPQIEPHLTHEEQVRYIATGRGFLGSSLDYVRNIEAKFRALGIVDAELAALCQAAEAYARASEVAAGEGAPSEDLARTLALRS